MSDERSAAGHLANSGLGLAEDVTAIARWQTAHEIQSLLDTLAVYRRYAIDLAAENTLLREEVTVLRALAASATSGIARGR